MPNIYSTHLKKRFIAGAICPVCKAADRVQLCTKDTAEWIECTECGHSEGRPLSVAAAAPVVKADTTQAAQVIQFKPHKVDHEHDS